MLPAGSQPVRDTPVLSGQVPSGHVDALDGVRALAAVAVLVFHVAIESAAALRDNFFSSLLARGDVAVPIFFALSGLLLYRPYARAALLGSVPRTPAST